MVKHIVLWKLRERTEHGSREENARRIKELLEGLNGKIPGLLKLEVGLDISQDPASVDVALYAEFADRAALETYQNHPLHVAVKPFVLAARETRTVVDYEI